MRREKPEGREDQTSTYTFIVRQSMCVGKVNQRLCVHTCLPPLLPTRRHRAPLTSSADAPPRRKRSVLSVLARIAESRYRVSWRYLIRLGMSAAAPSRRLPSHS